jgi:glycosidase
LAALTHWIRDYPVDALRLDAIWALRERAPALLATLPPTLTRINPDLALLAEASALDPYYAAHGFDAAYDWTARPGEWAWRDVFGAPGTTAQVGRLRESLTSESAREGPAPKVLRFLDDNDTGRRFITRHGAEQTRIAAVLLFTLPGIPLIYAGDEVGAEFEPYDMHEPIDWTDRHGLTPLYARLARRRHTSQALSSGGITMLATDADDRVLAFSRATRVASPGSDGPWVVVINFSPAPVHVRVRPADPLLSGRRTWSAWTPLDDARAVLRRNLRDGIDLPGYGAIVLELETR